MRQRTALLAIIILIAAALLVRYLVGNIGSGNGSATISETDLQQIEQLRCALDSAQIDSTHKKRAKSARRPASHRRKSAGNAQRPINTF